jgi:hypothetical protein
MYGHSSHRVTNPARTGLSRIYSHFDPTNSSRRKSRSKTPCCHSQSAPQRFLTNLFNPAENCVIRSSRLSFGETIACRWLGIITAASVSQFSLPPQNSSIALKIPGDARIRLRSFTHSVTKYITAWSHPSHTGMRGGRAMFRCWRPGWPPYKRNYAGVSLVVGGQDGRPTAPRSLLLRFFLENNL